MIVHCSSRFMSTSDFFFFLFACSLRAHDIKLNLPNVYITHSATAWIELNELLANEIRKEIVVHDKMKINFKINWNIIQEFWRAMNKFSFSFYLGSIMTIYFACGKSHNKHTIFLRVCEWKRENRKERVKEEAKKLIKPYDANSKRIHFALHKV